MKGSGGRDGCEQRYHGDAEQRRADAAVRPGHISAEPGDATRAVRYALEFGYRLIDTTSAYESTNPAHIRANTEVFDFEISPDDMAALDGLNEDCSVVSRGWRAQFELLLHDNTGNADLHIGEKASRTGGGNGSV